MAVNHFFIHGEIPPGCNSSFIALIPKVPDANLVKDFRPISLIGSIYKIIAKILSNRLVNVLGDIVNEVQSAFIAERQMLDGPFILNEILQWCTKKKKKTLIFKVDFEKAFDSIRWDFLDDVLKEFGFRCKWRNWIQSCLTSSKGSILVNGCPTNEFQFYKGLKQGDPLSPFLFILVMESLHLSFQRIVNAGMFKGIVLDQSLCLSHMFYADDAIFLGEWSDGNISTLIHVLKCFFHASGLKINLNKSKIMGINVESAQVIQAAAKLGCLVLKCPFYYLGTRVGGSMTRVQAWQEIVEKVKSRLSKWKSKTLSIGGRLTLLKSVLGSIPVFHMSIFKVPSKVLHILESIRSHFFNGHDPGSKKASWVKWNNVLTDKKRGGLGVSSLFALNRGLMIKWVWKFLSQKDSLWTKVIVAIHGVGGKIHSEWTSTGKSCWLSILSEVRSLQRKGMYVFDYLTHKMGNGESTKFWLDHWHTRGIFKDIFPRLYALESSKDVTVSSKIGDTSLVCSFRRIPRGGIEQNQFDSLVELVRSVTIVPSADRWNWNLESTGIFSVASARRRIDEICLPNIGEETRWVKCVPIKINVLAWKIKTDALPTRFNISRRGIDIQDMSCPICDNAIESTDHLFFRCGLVRDIANKVLSWWNLDHANLNSYAEWKSWLVSIRMDSKLKKMFEGVWYSIWCLIKLRVAFHAINARRLPLASLVYTLVRPPMTTSSANNSVFRGFFEKQKLTGPNFIDWYRQLRIVLSIEDKLNYLEQPLPPTLVPAAGVKNSVCSTSRAGASSDCVRFSLLQARRRQYVSSYVLKMKSYIDNLERLVHPVSLNLGVSLIFISLCKEFDSFVQNYNMHNMGKTINELHAMLKLHEKTLPTNYAPALHVIRAGKVQKVNNKHKKTQPQLVARGKNQGKGKNKLAYAPKPKIPPLPKREVPAKDSVYIFTIELNTFLNRSWIYDTGYGTHISNTTQGLRASRKLKPGALSLYVGNGQREAVEAIDAFHLCLPSGLVIVLNNCHYAPSITRGVIFSFPVLYKRIFDDGYVNHFVDNAISVSMNNLVYFSVVLRDGIFEIDLSNSNTNDSSMYVVSNKRAKLDLDSALLWHCRLGHISKKHIEKLQHDGLLNSTGLRAFEKCVSCMSGKMARKPYTHQVERVKDLLGLIHTDVCGSFKITSRQGANYFVTFTDDFSRYGYVYLLKHKHEVFETFKVFQKEVDNQLGKTIKSLRFDRGGEYMSQEFLDHLKDHGIIAHRTHPYTPQHNGNNWLFLLLPTDNKVLVDRNAEFLENSLITQEASGSLEDLKIIQEEDTHPFIDTRLHHEEDDLEIDEPQSDIIPIRRSTMTRNAPIRMCLYIDAEEQELGDLGEPTTYKAALLDSESDKWFDAMNVEMQSMKDNEVWDLVNLHPNGKTVGSKWLLKKKTDMNGAVHTYKACLVAKGYTQTPGIDYEETFSPVADIRAIRILIAIAAFYDDEIWKMDVKTAFLSVYLSEEVYMKQPEGFVNPKYPNRVCKLKRFIYRLKQASRQ
ncbi:retrotransposon protein, putative, ty1-copia subclass [Tanacetum coccineum]|uniref:Retrotransposon protein, putative, ty1-copia subclass n=2 Tax=Tanacetum coccineum TaxID=301880 RepID=A0ABQ5A4C5_9ASTR